MRYTSSVEPSRASASSTSSSCKGSLRNKRMVVTANRPRRRLIMKNAIFVAAAVLAISGSPAYATDWSVWAYATAWARGDHFAQQNIYECNGTRFSRCTPTFGPGAIATVSNSALKTYANVTAQADDYPATTYYSGYGIQHSDAFGSADLATGELKISDHSYALNGYSGGENTRASATAGLQDVLHFTSTSSTPALITVKLHVDGLIEGYQQPRFGFSMGNGYSSLAGTAGWADAADGVPSTTANAYFQPFNVTSGWSQFGPEDFIGTIAYDPDHPDFQLNMSLSAGGYAGSFVEYNHTASLAFDLPDGLTFTSASGVFLSEADRAVPEPSTWAMMIAGFALVGGAMRRASIKVFATRA